MSPTALQVHRDALIVDGLVFMGDGSTETLEAGSEAELRGFPGENLLRALDLAWAPP